MVGAGMVSATAEHIMSDFWVALQNRSFAAVLALPEIQIVPTHWGASATGGPEYAILDVYGPEAALWNCLDWLRYGVEIINGQGQAVWWGYVESVGLDTPSVSVSLSVDDMANSIKVEYGEGSTGYGEDAGSIAEYGRKQRVLSVDPVLASSVSQRLTAELASSQQPRPVQDIRRNEQAKVTLRCVGWLKTLSWLYYSRSHGLAEYVGTGSKEQAFGLGAVSSQLWFSALERELNDTDTNLGEFRTGQKITVTGSASNNATYTVASTTNAGLAGGPASPVNFDGQTAFLAVSPPGGDPATLAWMAAGERIRIMNTSLNNGWYYVAERSPSWAAMYVKFAETFASEAASAPQFWRGHSITLEEATVVEEKPGATVTLTVDGSQFGQQFVPAVSWSASSVAVKLRKIGTPSDNVEVTLRTNSGGVPIWPPLATATVAAASVSSNSAWTEFALDVPVALTANTTYWIVVRRTGTLDPLNYYTVALDEDAGYGAGYLRMYNGAAWVARTVDASMIFRVEGVEATTAQIAEIVDAAGQFLTGTALDDVSGIDTLQFRDGIVDALTELGDLLTLGTSNARRLLCAVERDRSLRVREEPAYTGTPDYVRHLDGRITTPQGVALSPGEVPVGVWLRVETPIPPGQGVNVDPTLLFVERCEYNAAGMEYNITPRGAVNIWRLAVAPSRG